MITTTRFRDVPWEEVKLCFSDGNDDDSEAWWEKQRGQPVQIVAAPVQPELVVNRCCEGPHWILFKRVGVTHRDSGVCHCAHILEID